MRERGIVLSVVVLMLLVLANVSTAVSQTSGVVTIAAGWRGPNAVAFDSGKDEFFVADTNTNDVAVVSDSSDSVVANVTVGSEPQYLTYDSGKGEVFVSGGEHT